MYTKPTHIQLPKNGSIDLGYLTIAESAKLIPFEIKRVFWAYYTPDNIVRGRHAHRETEMVLLAVSGSIILTTEMLGAPSEVFVLDKPNEGVYIPRLCWHTMQYSHDAVQLVLASTLYNETDYIRDYTKFKKYGQL